MHSGWSLHTELSGITAQTQLELLVPNDHPYGESLWTSLIIDSDENPTHKILSVVHNIGQTADGSLFAGGDVVGKCGSLFRPAVGE
jgi:hypothetical protein